jgi:hypothetical protein
MQNRPPMTIPALSVIYSFVFAVMMIAVAIRP